MDERKGLRELCESLQLQVACVAVAGPRVQNSVFAGYGTVTAPSYASFHIRTISINGTRNRVPRRAECNRRSSVNTEVMEDNSEI